MIPKQELFLNQKPISGTIDEILNNTVQINTDDINHCYKELMHEFNVSKKQAMKMYKEAKSTILKDTIDLMLKEGLIYVSGEDKKGQPLFKLKNKN